MILKNGSVIGNAKVFVDILPKGKVVTGDSNSQTSITIHNTGVWDVPAKNFNSAIKNNNAGTDRLASWHFTVDEANIYQHIPTDQEAWHTGVGERGNRTSVGIEICMFKDPVRQKKAEDNAIALAHHLGIKTLRTHLSWSGKFCPYVILSRKNGWEEFMARYKAYGQPVQAAPVVQTVNEYYVVQSGDTFWGIENKLKLTHGTIAKLNPSVNPGAIKVGQKLIIKQTAVKFHTIQSGENLWSIEEKLGLPHGTLQKLNPTINPGALQIGQKIIIG